jgi:hypothetical protein
MRLILRKKPSFFLPKPALLPFQMYNYDSEPRNGKLFIIVNFFEVQKIPWACKCCHFSLLPLTSKNEECKAIPVTGRGGP